MLAVLVTKDMPQAVLTPPARHNVITQTTITPAGNTFLHNNNKWKSV